MNKKKLIIFCLSIFLITPFIVNAGGIEFVPQVTIPGSSFRANTQTEIDSSSIANYIKSIYDYLLAIVGLTAAIALMIGGTLWLTSGGSSQRVSQAKSWISGSLTGLVLALLSYLILQTINPNLIEFTSLDVQKIKPIQIGCCKYQVKNSGNVAIDTSESECYAILTNPNKVNNPIPTTTQKDLDDNYSGLISEYINSQVTNKDLYMFDKDKNAKENECKVLGYHFWWDRSNPVNGGKTIAKATEGEWTTDPKFYLFNGYIDSTFISKKDFMEKEGDVNINRARINWLYICSSKGDGSKCKNSPIYCFCYNGEPQINPGKQNDPCGDNNSICIPSQQDGSDLCDNRDYTFWGGRGCTGGLICCKKDKISKNYDPSQP